MYWFWRLKTVNCDAKKAVFEQVNLCRVPVLIKFVKNWNFLHSSLIVNGSSLAMKEILVLSVLILSFQSTSCEEDCDTWPEGLKTLEGMLQRSTMRPYIEECFLDQSNLFIKNKSVNTGFVTHSYRSLSSSSRQTSFLWSNILNKAIEKCKFEGDESLSVKLSKYFNCIDDHLVNNCVTFKKTPRHCSQVEEHVSKCWKIEPECNWVHPESIKSCCQYPSFVDDELSWKCYKPCEKTEHFIQELHNCYFRCVNLEVKFFDD